MDTQINGENNQIFTQETYQNPYQEKMGWYKFLIYVQLPLSMVINVIMGLNFISGINVADFGIDNSIFKTTNTILGIAGLLMVGYTFCVHYGLRKYLLSAPKFLLLFNAVQVAINIIQIVVFSHVGRDITSQFSSIGAGIVLLIINYIYFEHRSSLFYDSDEGKFKKISIALLAASVVAYIVYMVFSLQLPKDAAASTGRSFYNYGNTYAQPGLQAQNNEYLEKDTEPISELEENADIEEAEKIDDSQTIEATTSSSEEGGPLIFSQYNTEYVAATIEGNTFTSNALGLTFEVPSNMKLYSDEELAGMDGVSADDFAQKLADDVDGGNIRTEMCVDPASSDFFGEVILRVKYFGVSDESLLDGLDMTAGIDYDALKERWGADDIAVDTMDGQFCGRAFKGMLLTYDIGGFKMYQKQYVFIYKGYVGYIIAYGESEEQCDQYLDAFASVE